MGDWKQDKDGIWVRTVDGVEERSSVNPNVTPGAREAADKHGVDISQIEGTGKDGAITKADIEANVPS